MCVILVLPRADSHPGGLSVRICGTWQAPCWLGSVIGVESFIAGLCTARDGRLGSAAASALSLWLPHPRRIRFVVA